MTNLDEDQQAQLVRLGRASGMSDEQMLDNMLRPVLEAFLRLFPAAVVERKFTEAANRARAKGRAEN